jgi:hypothetical protein
VAGSVETPESYLDALMEVFYSNGGLINYSQFQKLAGTKTGS